MIQLKDSVVFGNICRNLLWRISFSTDICEPTYFATYSAWRYAYSRERIRKGARTIRITSVILRHIFWCPYLSSESSPRPTRKRISLGRSIRDSIVFYFRHSVFFLNLMCELCIVLYYSDFQTDRFRHQ